MREVDGGLDLRHLAENVRNIQQSQVENEPKSFGECKTEMLHSQVEKLVGGNSAVWTQIVRSTSAQIPKACMK